MSNDKLFIPSKIKVGYQRRNDTYTKMLAYVIYYDVKGKLCKEKSWRGWIHDQPRNEYVMDDKNRYVKDENNQYVKELMPGLPIHDFDNVPTSGFVLNKKVGGGGGGWHHRQMKCRVWDPRGFEFEITLDNLLFILQESNSFKGKGLEGDMIYAWSGKDLVLLPCESEDYKSSVLFTELKTQKVKKKEIVEGHTFMGKDTKTYVYLGEAEYLNFSHYANRLDSVTKEHMFYDVKEDKYVPLKLNTLARVMDNSVVQNYAGLITGMQEAGVLNNYEVVIEDYKFQHKLPDETAKGNYQQISRLNQSLNVDKAFLMYDDNVFRKVNYIQVSYDTTIWHYDNFNYSSNYHAERQKLMSTEQECKVKFNLQDGYTRYVLNNGKLSVGSHRDYDRTLGYDGMKKKLNNFKILKLRFPGGKEITLE